MQHTAPTVPLATRNPVSIVTIPGASNPVASIASGSNTSSSSSQSWSAVLKALQNGHHGGVHRHGINPIQTSNDSGSDAFGVSSASEDTSVDAFGTPSVKPSSTSNLIASISDPFTSIASNLAVRAQLGSPTSLLTF